MDVNQEIHHVHYIVMHLHLDVNKAPINTFFSHDSDHVGTLCLETCQWGIALDHTEEDLIL